MAPGVLGTAGSMNLSEPSTLIVSNPGGDKV